MVKRVIIFLSLFFTFLNASLMVEEKWKSGETFLDFLEERSLPLSIYYNLDKEEKELAAEINAGVNFQILKNDNEEIEQVLIPIGEQLQLHIIKENSGYVLKTSPIAYQEYSESVVISIESSPYQDIVKETNNYLLANEFVGSFKNSINFKRALRKGDKLVILYKQKIRLGKQFGSPVIESAMVQTKGKENYIFLYEDRYYDINGKEIEGFFLSRPCRYTRISSRFTYKRWHPILKRYRAHLGIDYAAPVGTPVRAAANGKVIYVGRKGGYGKTVIIRHENGYKTLYAHLSRYKRGIRSRWVKKGNVIGYVGNTGMSTGPHLHFGLYKNNRAINPNSVIKITKNKLNGKKIKKFMELSKRYKESIKIALLENKKPHIFSNFDYLGSLDTNGKQWAE